MTTLNRFGLICDLFRYVGSKRHKVDVPESNTYHGDFRLSPFQEWRMREVGLTYVEGELICTGVHQEAVRQAVRETLTNCALAGAIVIGSSEYVGLLNLGSARLKERVSPTAGLASMVAPSSNVLAEGMEVQYAQTGLQEWTVTIKISSVVGDVMSMRFLQLMIATYLCDTRQNNEIKIDMYLKYMAWQRLLAEREVPMIASTTAPARDRLLSARWVEGPATPRWLSLDLPPAVVESLNESAKRHGLSADEVVLVCWRMLTEAWTDTVGLPITVGINGRQAPIPSDLLGQASPWMVWAPTANESFSVRQRMGAASTWFQQAADHPVWNPAAVRSSFGFLVSLPQEQIVNGNIAVILTPPVPDPVGTILTLVASLGPDQMRLGLWFDDSRIFGDDAIAMLRSVESLVGTIEEIIDDDWVYSTQIPMPRTVSSEKGHPTLWSRIAVHVEATPNAVALKDGRGEISYFELAARAELVAKRLMVEGVGPDSRVGILAEDSPQTVIAMLGVLHAGGAYVPLDPRLPEQRLASMVQVSKVDVVLLTENLRHLDIGGRQILLESVETEEQSEEESRIIFRAPVDVDLAYVLFTSGSTGLPKGVMVTRQGLDNYIDAAVSTYLHHEGDVISFTSPGFDLTITSLLAPLAAGRTVRLVSSRNPLDEVLKAMGESNVSLLKLTPSHLIMLTRLLVGKDNIQVGTVVVGGEELTVDAAEAWLELQPDCAIFNEYGPTETVVGCTSWRFDGSEQGFRDVPIGYTLPGSRVYVVNRLLRPVVDMARGEIAIGGVGVARGYSNSPRATAERFVPDPYGLPGSRMYLSGDVGFVSAAHGLRFIGRKDGQISLHGYRIEPGEVETALRGIDGVAHAVVRKSISSEVAVLVAYVVMTLGTPFDDQLIRARLAEVLPGYMIPRYVVRLSELPLTLNGKIDDSILRRIPLVSNVDGATIPATENERAIQAVWAEVLGVEAPSLEARFFDLGGTSFALVKVVARLREVLHREIAVAAFFEHPTIREFAAYLSRGQSDRLEVQDRTELRRVAIEQLRLRRGR